MKRKGSVIAVVFLLAAIGSATLAQLQSCGADEPQETMTSIPDRTSRTVRTTQTTPATDSEGPVTSGSPSVGTTSGTSPHTAPHTTKAPPATSTPATSDADATTTAKPVTTPAPPQTAKPPVTAGPKVPEELGFVADLSAYEKYMNPTGNDWNDAYLLLVNAAHPIGKDAELSVPALKNIVYFKTVTAYNHEKYKAGQQLNAVAMQALTAMFLEAKAEGISNLYATSAYRTYSYQTTVFNRNVSNTYRWLCESCGNVWIGKSAKCALCGKTTKTTLDVTQAEKEANVATYSCRPGTSDHQTGLAVDIVQTSLPSEYMSLIQEFGETAAGKWLAANAHKFGFVLRFPEDKEDITGIIYEPWHFRFVGREHATYMYENNLCLEEYVAYLERTGYFG